MGKNRHVPSRRRDAADDDDDNDDDDDDDYDDDDSCPFLSLSPSKSADLSRTSKGRGANFFRAARTPGSSSAFCGVRLIAERPIVFEEENRE